MTFKITELLEKQTHSTWGHCCTVRKYQFPQILVPFSGKCQSSAGLRKMRTYLFLWTGKGQQCNRIEKTGVETFPILVFPGVYPLYQPIGKSLWTAGQGSTQCDETCSDGGG